jgi:hypothetical protein
LSLLSAQQNGILENEEYSPTGSENHLSPYDFKHLTGKYFEIGMKLNDFSIQLMKY